MYLVNFLVTLLLTTCSILPLVSQNSSKNIALDRYINIDGDTIYYRISGKGIPLVLLHGGLYGSIDDFNPYIELLSSDFMVIAVSTRGYYRSDIGEKNFSYTLLASDVSAIIKKEMTDPGIIVGYSDGAITAYKFASLYPEQTYMIISLAGTINRAQYKDRSWITQIDLDQTMKEKPKKIEKLIQNMRSPERINELIFQLKNMWNTRVYTSKKEIKKIVVPTLIIGGYRDDFFPVESFIETYRLLPNSELLILPNKSHKLLTNELFIDYIIPFIHEHISK